MAAPAQPTNILRGHRAQVHAAAFVTVGLHGSADGAVRLATGDADGFAVLWDLTIVRPRAVWRAHESSILGLDGWRSDDGGHQIATHGRDHKLIVWQLGAADEERLSTSLPLEDGGGGAEAGRRPAPWMVHVLDVNSLNFCAFAWCVSSEPVPVPAAAPAATERLIAVPNTMTLEAVDIFHLPSQCRINTVQAGASDGMLMALALFHQSSSGALVLVAAFENGAVVLATLDDGPRGRAVVRYRAQPHAQPILSLAVAPDHSYFLTSGADAIVAKHPVPALRPATGPAPGVRRAVPAPVGAAASSGAAKFDADTSTPPAKPVSLLAAALARDTAAGAPPHPSVIPVRGPPPEPETQPLQILDTRHAGQQSLRIRSDGRIFATAGWDGRARVYSTKTMKEVAVLKWHQLGCAAVAFAPVTGGGPDATTDRTVAAQGGRTRELSVKERRLRHAETAHWLAVGSKDSKVSLWDIF